MEAANKATFCGLTAILLWSLTVGFMRSVTESFGALGGIALAYTVTAFLLIVRSRSVGLRDISKTYLFGCGSLFVVYNIMFSLAVGLAVSNQQTLEVALLNYLWPCFIIVLAIPMAGVKAGWLLTPGLALSFFGVVWCLSSGSLNFTAFADNLRTNPFPYILAFSGAVCWGLYCNLARLFGKNSDCVGYFFLAAALVLWLLFFISGDALTFPGARPVIDLVVLGAIWALSYALWETGVQKGNMTLLAASSYFIPVLSILFASLWLSVQPHHSFWYGVIMVVGGSLICWAATKNARARSS